MNISDVLKDINEFLWGPYMLALLVGTGVFLTVRLKFLPWRNLGYALKSIVSKDKREKKSSRDAGDISPFQSLMTALAATIGTGNIVGVATAMVMGGPGALVWMWVSAFFGLSTKYAESVLAVKYRETNSKGEMCGGPMYAMKNGINIGKVGPVMAILFSVFTVCASFGIGNTTQANSIANALENTFNWPAWYTGIALVILVFAVLVGGIKNIGSVCGLIVPIMAIFYFLTGVLAIILNYANIPAGLTEIFSMAFSPRAAAGGVGGTITATMLSSMRWGIARGVFSNEAGLGSAPIAAAAAKTNSAAKQGYINMTGTFIDTIIVCTVTGLVIASSGVLGTTDAAGEIISGVDLTIMAFSSVIGGWGRYIITIGITLFAFSTILGWEYYGEKALEYLVQNRTIIFIYRIIFALVTYIGATRTLDAIWNFADIMNGLMAIPNLICLILLSNVIAKETFQFQKDRKRLNR